MPEPPWRVPSEKRAEIFRHLTGETVAGANPPEITETGQGGKFRPDGTVLVFPGNTFICHIDRASAFHAALCEMQDTVRTRPYADHFAFLPKPSFHMTIFCGISGAPLGVDGWPEGLPRDATLEAVSAEFRDRLRGERGPDGYSVKATGLRLPMTIEMEPASEAEGEKLLDMRNKLQAVTGIYRPDFDEYRFHVSLAYLTRRLSPAEAETVMADVETLFERLFLDLEPVALGPVEFCEFETMHHFEPMGRLGPNGFG